MTRVKQDESRRRSATRAPVDRPIKLQFDDSMEVIEGLCSNVSIGGMFILFDNSRPPGSLVRFELEVPGNNAIRGLGEVVWTRAKSDLGGPEAGFGLKFRFLEQRDRQMIFKLVSQHIKERLTRSQPAEPEGRETDPIGPSTTTAPADGRPDARTAPSIAVPPAPEAPSSPPSAAPATPASRRSTVDTSLRREAERDQPLPPTATDVDLDPAVGETPIYELGLEAPPMSPEPSLIAPPEAAEADPAAAPPASNAEAFSDPGAPAAQEWSTGAHLLDGAAEEGGGRAARREFPILPVIVVLLAAGLAGFYLFQDEIRGRSSEPDLPEAGQQAAAPAGQRDTAAPDDSSVTTGLPPAAAPPLSGRGDTPSAEPSDTSAAPPAAPLAVPPAVPPTRAAQPPPTRAAQPPPARAVQPPPDKVPEPDKPAETSSFSRLQDVSWSEVPGGMRIVLTADGAIPTGRYNYFRLEGDPPREVLRLIGVEKSFDKRNIPVGGSAVRQIRTGFHHKNGRDEIHVVIDLTGPQWRLTEVRNLGPRLELVLGRE